MTWFVFVGFGCHGQIAFQSLYGNSNYVEMFKEAGYF